MPQLNPNPWFYMLAFSWMIFLAVILPMVLVYHFPNDPSMLDPKSTNTQPWAWPWS
nr:ATPase subunit 8 [Gymnotus aff. pantherinus Lineage III RJ]